MCILRSLSTRDWMVQKYENAALTNEVHRRRSQSVQRNRALQRIHLIAFIKMQCWIILKFCELCNCVTLFAVMSSGGEGNAWITRCDHNFPLWSLPQSTLPSSSSSPPASSTFHFGAGKVNNITIITTTFHFGACHNEHEPSCPYIKNCVSQLLKWKCVYNRA